MTTAMVGGKKLRVLCLHGFRTSGAIMKDQVLGKWPECLTSNLDLVFLDAPFPAEGRSDVDGLFPPPYYEWYQFDKEALLYRNFDECLKYVEDYMIEQGTFDGLIGFSRGGTLSAALAGMQAKGIALQRVPKLKFVVIIGGGLLLSPDLQEKAYSAKIESPSLHFIGEMDYLKPQSEELLGSFINPLIVSHPRGHTVPRLGGTYFFFSSCPTIVFIHLFMFNLS
ncbi:Serine hydrolase family protein [Zostera marina]|uniref:Serine hydrolase family protein n=1 Tax=Zostera marina TaxID=29655 RepID=A0A0K9PWG1_ZOSMR|nr:Serine hydrolase family protein [Zostera marina]